jgi:hypothetical protein
VGVLFSGDRVEGNAEKVTGDRVLAEEVVRDGGDELASRESARGETDGANSVDLCQTESVFMTRTSAPQNSVDPMEAGRAQSDTDGLLGDDEAGGESELVGVLGA